MQRDQSYGDFMVEHLEALIIDVVESHYDPALAREVISSSTFQSVVRRTRTMIVRQVERLVLDAMKQRRRRETDFH